MDSDILKLNICMMIVSMNVTDIYNTVPATELSTVQMLRHLILMSTLEGRYYYHFQFIDEDSG